MYCVGSHFQEMDLEGQIQGHVHRSKRYLEEMYDQGAAILANMAGNRERLKVGAKGQGGRQGRCMQPWVQLRSVKQACHRCMQTCKEHMGTVRQAASRRDTNIWVVGLWPAGCKNAIGCLLHRVWHPCYPVHDHICEALVPTISRSAILLIFSQFTTRNNFVLARLRTRRHLTCSTRWGWATRCCASSSGGSGRTSGWRTAGW